MRTMTVSILGAIMAGLVFQAQAGTAEQAAWSDSRVEIPAMHAGLSDMRPASAPCLSASSQAKAVKAVHDDSAAQPAHLYDTLERLVSSGQVLYMRHTLSGADQWLTEQAETSACMQDAATPAAHSRNCDS